MTEKVKAGVIGWPIAQSRSPLIHNYWLAAHTINGSYEKFAVEPDRLEQFIAEMRDNGLQGLNATIPHKEALITLADRCTPTATAIGAANTLYFEERELVADNTDAYGFITHLKNSAAEWRPEKPALILGAGGAARAIIHALREEGVPEIRLANRTKSRAEALQNEFGAIISVIDWDQRAEALSDCNLLVNSTSLGMTGKPPLDMSLEKLSQGSTVYDIVYAPLKTELLTAAETKGATPVDGLGMLLHQAAPGFEQWFGVRPTVTTELRNLIIQDLQG